MITGHDRAAYRARLDALERAVDDRLQRALAAVAERDTWIRADPQRAAAYEAWAADRARTAREVRR